MNEVDIVRLTSYLALQIQGFEVPVEITKFAGGQSNPTYLIKAPSKKYVLRRKPHGPILPSAHAIDREFRVLKALSNTGVPMATALHYCTDVSVIGSEFYLMDFIDGTVHWDPALPEMSPAQRRPAIEAMIDVLSELHKLDWNAIGLSDFGRPQNYVGRQISRWTRQYRATADGSYPGMERLIMHLEATLPPDDGRAALVHGDFRIDNLIYEKDGCRVLAVLDWELSTIGHPSADLAYMLMHHRLPNTGVFRGLGGVDRAAQNLPTESEIIARYSHTVGLDEPIDLSFWISLSAFRLASILEGVRARIRDGNASDPERGEKLMQVIPDLIELGLNP